MFSYRRGARRKCEKIINIIILASFVNYIGLCKTNSMNFGSVGYGATAIRHLRRFCRKHYARAFHVACRLPRLSSLADFKNNPAGKLYCRIINFLLFFFFFINKKVKRRSSRDDTGHRPRMRLAEFCSNFSISVSRGIVNRDVLLSCGLFSMQTTR